MQMSEQCRVRVILSGKDIITIGTCLECCSREESLLLSNFQPVFVLSSKLCDNIVVSYYGGGNQQFTNILLLLLNMISILNLAFKLHSNPLMLPPKFCFHLYSHGWYSPWWARLVTIKHIYQWPSFTLVLSQYNSLPSICKQTCPTKGFNEPFCFSKILLEAIYPACRIVVTMDNILWRLWSSVTWTSQMYWSRPCAM